MKKYQAYKDSEVEAIGMIPEGWDIGKLNQVTTKLTNGFVGPTRDVMQEDGVRYIQGVHIKSGKISFTPNGPYYVSKEWSNQHSKSILKEGDVLIVQSGTIGEVGYVTQEFEDCNCHALIIVRIRKDIGSGKYLTYFIRSNYVHDFFQLIKTGEILEHLNTTRISDLKICIPSFHEQSQIVAFLDQKTSIIDDLIQKKLQKIELLREHRASIINQAITKGLVKDVGMKDSEVTWIGEIPENWKVNKIKRLATTISKGTTPSTIGKEMIEEGEIRFLKAENIKNNEVSFDPTFYIDIETDTLLKRSSLKDGDILFVIAGATIGKTAILSDQFIPANTNQAVSFIRLKRDENKRFVWYWLLSTRIQEQISLDSVQSAQPNLSMEDLGNFQIPYPPLTEQHQIVEYLDKKTSEIDKQVDIENRKIDLLKEYRQSLISEVVTGKIDVRTN